MDTLKIQGGSEDFIPIRAEGFASGSKSQFDVYVRLDSGKFLKLLEAGDQFSPDRIDNYIKKGVTHFYIPKEMQKAYLQYCEKLSVAVLKSTRVSEEIKTGMTLNHGDELMTILRSQGVNAENIEYAKTFIGDLKNLTHQLQKYQPIVSFLNDVSAFEHGVSSSMIAAILSHVLEIRMDQPVEVVGLSAFFHDVGLSALPPEARKEDELEFMSAENRELYKTHPALGANILYKTGDIKPAVIQAVEQHHMKHLGFGFPERKNNSASLGRVAEIVGISEELARLSKSNKASSPAQMLAELERTVFPGFSKQIVYAFRTAFFPKT
jgi:HD-GYP domain-containing protein (c-di-GMP phosphodiesterase class II)